MNEINWKCLTMCGYCAPSLAGYVSVPLGASRNPPQAAAPPDGVDHPKSKSKRTADLTFGRSANKKMKLAGKWLTLNFIFAVVAREIGRADAAELAIGSDRCASGSVAARRTGARIDRDLTQLTWKDKTPVRRESDDITRRMVEETAAGPFGWRSNLFRLSA